jgi:hypothetical protein
MIHERDIILKYIHNNTGKLIHWCLKKEWFIENILKIDFDLHPNLKKSMTQFL